MQTKIIIPDSDNDGSSNQDHIDHTIWAFCATFGGATVTKGKGHWIGSGNKVYHDDVTIIEAYSTNKTIAQATVETLAEQLLNNTDQEAIFTAVENEAKIIIRDDGDNDN